MLRQLQVAGRRPKLTSRNILSVVLIVSVGVLVLYPVLILGIRAFVSSTEGTSRWTLEPLRFALSSPEIVDSLKNTFVLALIRQAISLPLGLGLAALIARTDLPGKGYLYLTMWLAFFLPTLPITIGWTLIFDAQLGYVNQLWRQVTGSEHHLVDVYSYFGITIAHLSASTLPLKVILLTPAFIKMDRTLEEAARSAGASAFRTMHRITLPLLLPAIIVAVIVSVIRSLEAFEIELFLGTPSGIYVFGNRIYEMFRWEPPRFTEAVSLALLSFASIVPFLVAYVWISRNFGHGVVSGHGYQSKLVGLGSFRIPAAIIVWAFVVFLFGAPLLMLVMGTFMRVWGFPGIENAWTLGNWRTVLSDTVFIPTLMNTLKLGFGAMALGMTLYTLLAMAMVKSRMSGKRLLDLLVWLPWAIPGPLLGFAVLVVILETPGLYILYGTINVLILVAFLNTMPLGTQILKTDLAQINDELLESGRIAGATWLRTYIKIALPIAWPAVLTIGILSFVSAAKNISSMAFVYTAESRPLSLLMLDYGVVGERERAAVVGVIVTMITILIVVVARRMGLRLK